MREQGARPAAFPRSALMTITISLLYLASPQNLCAQSGGGQSSPQRPRPAPGSAQPRPAPAPAGIAERELVMREMEKEAAAPPADAAGAALPLGRIAADFRRIQIVNNRMLGAVMGAAEPDYRLISEANAEIRKCAARLKSGLSLPEPEAPGGEGREYRPPGDAAQMKAALLLLDRALMSFVKNPVFKNADVVDAREGARARRDWERVIELSRLIGRDAERMSKAAGRR
jgi:hypothetical protein